MKLRKALDRRGRRGLRAVVAQIILLSLVLGMFHIPVHAAGLLFSDGFESGDLLNWTTVNGLVVQQDEVYAGDYAVRGTSTGTPTYAYKQLSGTYTELYYRLWFKVISQGATNQVVLQRFGTAANADILAAFVGQTGKLNLRNEITNANVSSDTTVTQGVWHQLQVRVKIDTIAGIAGESEVWLDDVRIDQLSITQDLGMNPVGFIQLGETSNFRTYDIALDRVAVNTAFIDPADPPEVIETTPEIEVEIAGAPAGTHTVDVGHAITEGYDGLDNGPVHVQSTDTTQIVASEGMLYQAYGTTLSFAEMMGLPNAQLDNVYWLPWYNNVNLNTQLRFANVSNQQASIEVFIAGQEVPDSPFILQPGESTRQSFPDINDGPVEIRSNVNIVAAERVMYKVRGAYTSYSEMMALPEGQLDNVYWLPWYNNVNLDTQLRFANVTDQPASVTVFIGGEQQGDPINLPAGESTRVSFADINDGPVEIRSNVKIVAAERVIYKVGGVHTSFTEMMGLPESQLSTTYWLPWYNHVDMDTQVRFGNVSESTATVHVFIAGQEVPNSPFILQPGESTRQSFAGIIDGPVEIRSDVNIVAAERVIYKANGVHTSFTEMMGLPDELLDTTYWFPWYNNEGLVTDLRLAVP